jgi:hypothetical protein
MRRFLILVWMGLLLAPAVEALEFVNRAPVVFPIKLDNDQGGALMPQVASDGRGNFVTTWRQDRFNKESNIMVAVLGITSLRHDFTVSQAAFNASQAWQVAMNRHGDFVVLYSTQAAGKLSYQAQVFTLGGTLLSGPIEIVKSLTANQPALGIDDAGDFDVTWSDDPGVFVSRFNRAGKLLSSALVKSPEPNASGSTVVVQPDGSFTLAWHTFDPSRAAKVGVIAERFDRAGKLVGQPIVVHRDRYAISPLAGAATIDGGFVLAWNGCPTDFDHCQVQARRYDYRGRPATGELAVSKGAVTYVPAPAVAADVQGNFAVAWKACAGAQGPCTVSALLYDAANVRAQRVASLPSSEVFTFPGIAAGPKGFLVTFESFNCTAASCHNEPPTGIYGWRLDY